MLSPTVYLRIVKDSINQQTLRQWWSESSDVKYQSPAYRDSFGSAEGEWRDVKIEREDA